MPLSDTQKYDFGIIASGGIETLKANGPKSSQLDKNFMHAFNAKIEPEGLD